MITVLRSSTCFLFLFQIIISITFSLGSKSNLKPPIKSSEAKYLSPTTGRDKRDREGKRGRERKRQRKREGEGAQSYILTRYPTVNINSTHSIIWFSFPFQSPFKKSSFPFDLISLFLLTLVFFFIFFETKYYSFGPPTPQFLVRVFFPRNRLGFTLFWIGRSVRVLDISINGGRGRSCSGRSTRCSFVHSLFSAFSQRMAGGLWNIRSKFR